MGRVFHRSGRKSLVARALEPFPPPRVLGKEFGARTFRSCCGWVLHDAPTLAGEVDTDPAVRSLLVDPFTARLRVAEARHTGAGPVPLDAMRTLDQGDLEIPPPMDVTLAIAAGRDGRVTRCRWPPAARQGRISSPASSGSFGS